MYKTFLSLRYLRRRRTNWIGMAGIAIAVAALILILSIMSGFLAESRAILRGSLADVIIQPNFYKRLADGTRIPTRPQRHLDVVRSDPRVAGACAQIQYGGMIRMRGRGNLTHDPQRQGLAYVTLVGIDVEAEYATTELEKALEAPSLWGSQRPLDVDDPFAPPPGYDPEERDSRPLERVLIGEQLARAWYLSRGDEIEIGTISQAAIDDDTGEMSNQRYVIAGTFRSGDNEMDTGRVYMQRHVLADLLGEGDYFTHILVRLADYGADAAAAVPELHQRLFEEGLAHDPLRDPDEVRTWERFKQVFLAAVENEKSLMGIMLSLVMVVAGFTVFALLSMMVSEKRRDIGILSALGAGSTGVLTVFLLIGFWQALFGTLLGAAAGIWGALEIDAIERWLSSTFGFQIFDRNVYYFDHIPSVIEPVGVATIVLGAFVCTLMFAAIPALRAARMHPIDALRYE